MVAIETLDTQPLEPAMNKSALAITTLVVALPTMLASSAEAHGFGMHGGFGVPIFNSYSSDSGYYSHRECNHSYQARSPARETVHVAKKPSQTNVAKADASARVEFENSSIAVSSADVADAKTTSAPVKTATVESANIGCKEFFPSVGMTLTVPCK